VATGRALGAAAAIGAGLLAAGAMEGAAARPARLLAAAIRTASAAEPSTGGALEGALREGVALCAPPALAAAAAALAAGLLQTGGLLAPGALRWRWDRLDPAAGLRRAAAPGAVATGLLQAALAAAAPGVAAAALAGLAPALAAAPRLGAGGAAGLLLRAAAAVAGPLLALLAAAGAAELLLARRRLARSLRMTRDEVARDLREDEGDPHVRGERRRRHAEPPAGGVPRRAACVVVNPTRIAVALGHRRGSDEPPVVLAKRLGAQAAALRRVARRAGVPVVRDPDLARALWRLAEVGEAIPEELFEAAAAVLAAVYAAAREGAG
jgi:flagellar biosynthesis protein FlhB